MKDKPDSFYRKLFRLLLACLLVLILSFGEATYTDIQYSRYPWYFESLKVRNLREREPKQHVVVAIMVATIAEDVLTGGAGISNDRASIQAASTAYRGAMSLRLRFA